MYKTTQDQGDFRNRVASHATKPSRRGIIHDVPSWASEPEEYYNSLLEQFDALTTQLHDTRERVIWLRKQLKTTLPYETFARLQHELDYAGPRLAELEQETGLLRTTVRAASNNAWGAVFYFLANKRLSHDIFRELDEATQALLQREHQEIGKGNADRSPEKRARQNRAHHLKDRREKVRNALEAGTYQSHSVGNTYHAGPRKSGQPR